MTARTRYVQLGLEQLGKTVLWAHKGPDVFDCSGLATWLLRSVGGPDLCLTHNAQKLHDETPELAGAAPQPGDWIFYGLSSEHVEHVGIWLVGGKALSADGATPRITTIAEALASPLDRVRLHETTHFRRDLPYESIHRNVRLDALDAICL